MQALSKVEIDKDGARKFVKKRYFSNNCDIICELLGCAPGNASKIHITLINNWLVQTINDYGLKEDDITRLSCFFNGGTNGHSEWGMGSRAAAAQLTKTSSQNVFYCLDKTKGVGYKFD